MAVRELIGGTPYLITLLLDAGLWLVYGDLLVRDIETLGDLFIILYAL